MTKTKITPLYERLSRDDELQGESNSISNHENDEEWRMIRPRMHGMRTFIKARPRKIILGLRMPEYERKLVISAAKIAGIQEIHKMYINDSDELDSRSLEEV
ncbi:MAG: hypothetical protein K2P41_00355 [Lachnospiraceae bacterium]|nr:hypothetical protein [Lachnospiraceae bacterium]